MDFNIGDKVKFNNTASTGEGVIVECMIDSWMPVNGRMMIVEDSEGEMFLIREGHLACIEGI